MRRLSAAALALAAGTVAAQPPPPRVSFDELMRLVERSPRVAASRRDADMVRAERAAAGALPNPTLSLGRSTPGGGERTVFDARAQDQALLELPLPVFGQRGARIDAADAQLRRAESQARLTLSETRRVAGLAFVRLAAASEAFAARRAALADVERIRGLVSGREQSGLASRYDLARADAELALARLGAERSLADLGEHSAAIAALLDAPGWRPEPADALAELHARLREPQGDLAANPALRVAREESAAAEARVALARRERFPVPALQLGRTWTSGPYGSANFLGVASEIPILDTRRALEDRARAEQGAVRERERALSASLQAEFRRQREAVALRAEALARFEREVSARQGDFLAMAESAYRLGRGTLFELLDARRTQLDAALARIELLSALVESELELRALSGAL